MIDMLNQQYSNCGYKRSETKEMDYIFDIPRKYYIRKRVKRK